jgi:hypothetical protein
MVIIIGLGALTEVATKSSVFWDAMSWNPLKVNGRFWETHCLNLQDGIIRQPRSQRTANSKQSSATRRRGVTSQTTEPSQLLFISVLHTLEHEHDIRCVPIYDGYFCSFFYFLFILYIN